MGMYFGKPAPFNSIINPPESAVACGCVLVNQQAGCFSNVAEAAAEKELAH